MRRPGRRKKTADAKTEIKPVLVEPLNSRERGEVKEAMEKGKLEDNKHASSLFKQFDRQLQSVPDSINNKQLTGQDKLKLLTGDYSDHQNTKFKVQPNKTVKMEGKGNGLLSNLNSAFSPKQIEAVNQKKQPEPLLGLGQ